MMVIVVVSRFCCEWGEYFFKVLNRTCEFGMFS